MVFTEGLSASGRRRRARTRPAGVRPAIRRLAAAGVALALLVVWPLAAWEAADGALEIHAIDVGQGDALAIHAPEGGWILVDAGDRSGDWDAGRERVVPFLLQHGVRRLAALVLTHPHADHIGGAAAVLEAFEVGVIIDPAVPTGTPMYLSLLRQARESGTRWLAARPGREVRVGGITLRFLYPDTVDERRGANEYSVVFLLEYGRFAALFTGDAPAAVEEVLVERHGARLRVDLLKVGHHGSATSTSELLLDVARPEIALISVGRWNRYGHPHPRVLERLARHGVRVYRTDRDGAITVRVGAGGRMHVETTR